MVALPMSVYRRELDLETLVCTYRKTVAILAQEPELWPSQGRHLDFRRQAGV
jgi:hypothetical protein